MHIIYGATLYSSGTVTATGNTGVIAVPLLPNISQTPGIDSNATDMNTRMVAVPLWFTCKGSDQATDETNDVTIDWYADSAGEFTFGTTTFAQMTAGDMLPPIEYWPGDVTGWDIDYTGATEPPNAPWIPCPPYHKITHTLAGTTKSMSYIVTMTYLLL